MRTGPKGLAIGLLAAISLAPVVARAEASRVPPPEAAWASDSSRSFVTWPASPDREHGTPAIRRPPSGDATVRRTPTALRAPGIRPAERTFEADYPGSSR